MSDTNSRYSRRNFLTTAGATAGALALAGCTQQTSNGGNGGELSGVIDIAGSSTVFPLATAVAEDFKAEYGDVDINLQSTGTGGGFANHFCPGRTDFNNASRPIKPTEEQNCSDNGITSIELQVATDALTIVVNNGADWVDCMTLEELKQLWSAETAPETWNDINSEWPDEPLELYGPTDASGTYDYFHESILGEETDHRRDYSSTEQDRTIISGVEGSKYAMGYMGYAYYSESTDRVKAIGVDNGDGCVKPSLETAKSGEYSPLSRPLFTYAKQSSLAENHVAEFARYWIDQMDSRELVADDVGYVPLDADQKSAVQDTLESAIEAANQG